MLELLYRGIVEHIREHMPEILWIDLYNDQYLDLQKEDPPVWPAIFIEWGNIPWTQLAQRCTEADATITLHYCTENYLSSRQSDNPSLPPHPAQALEYLRGLGRLHLAFQGALFRGTYEGTEMPITSAWMKAANIQDTNHDGLHIERVSFRCKMYDYTAHPDWKRVPVDNLQIVVVKA